MTRSKSHSGLIPILPAIALLLTLPFSARAESVGAVTRVQNQAQVGATTAVVGAPVHMNDRLRTGANARLEVTYNDNSKLTLGENANATPLLHPVRTLLYNCLTRTCQTEDAHDQV